MTKGVTGKISSNFSASGGILTFTKDNLSVSAGVVWGKDDYGLDMTWYGETSGAYMTWAGDNLTLVNAEFICPSASFTTAAISSASVRNLNLASASVTGNIQFVQTATLTFAGGANLAFDTATGTKIGTGSTQKIGFFGATPTTPIKFSISAVDIASAMRDLGFMTTASA